jgi:hypothetical protein
LFWGCCLVLYSTLPGLAYDEPQKVAVDSSGNVYVSGSSHNGANYDYVTIKYSAAGAWVWGASYDGPD